MHVCMYVYTLQLTSSSTVTHYQLFYTLHRNYIDFQVFITRNVIVQINTLKLRFTISNILSLSLNL